MFFRRAWQRVGPLARRVFRPVSRDAVPVRHMAFGGFPGGSTNMTYFVLCGGGLTAAVVYAYKTVNGDTERYEERLASMGSTETAKAAPEAAAPAAEPITKELEAPAAEAAIESVSAPAEPVAETSAEPVVEASPEEESAGAASESIVTEAAAEPAVTDDAAPPAALEELPEAAVEVAATVETLAEAPAAESAEPMPDLLTAVKILANSTVEIAAASVGETDLVKAVLEIEADGKGPDSTQEVSEPDALEAATETEYKEAPEEAPVVESEEELRSAEPEEEAGAEDGHAPAVEEAMAEETPASAEAEEEEKASSAPTLEEVEDQTPHPETASEEGVSCAEDAVPAEEATPVAEATPSDEMAAAKAATEGTVGAAVDTTQLAAASTGSDLEALSAAVSEATLEAPVQEAKHCHSCHSAPSSGEEVAPPAALGEELVTEEAVDIAHETKEEVSQMEGQTIESVVVVTV